MSKVRVVLKPGGFVIASLVAMVVVIVVVFLAATQPELFQLGGQPRISLDEQLAPAPAPSTYKIPDTAKHLTDWLVLRPVPTGLTVPQTDDEASKKSRLDTMLEKNFLPDESRLDPHPNDTVTVGNANLHWIPVTGETVDLVTAKPRTTAKTGETNAIAYAVTTIEVPKAVSDATLYLGSDDAVLVWLNGKEVWRNSVHRGCNPGQDKVPALALNAGRNVLVFKVVQLDGEWGVNAALDIP